MSTVRISRLALDFSDEISQMDLSPLIVGEAEKGVIALDALVISSDMKQHCGSAASTEHSHVR
jgi:hypothetical protein